MSPEGWKLIIYILCSSLGIFLTMFTLFASLLYIFLTKFWGEKVDLRVLIQLTKLINFTKYKVSRYN